MYIHVYVIWVNRESQFMCITAVLMFMSFMCIGRVSVYNCSTHVLAMMSVHETL